MPKIQHDNLSKTDIISAIGLSRHVYDDASGFEYDLSRLDEINFEWRIVTDDLRLHGLSPDNLEAFSIGDGSYYTNKSFLPIPTPFSAVGEAVASVYQNIAQPDTIAVSFRGTDGFGDVFTDLTADFSDYYDLFNPFVESLVGMINTGPVFGTSVQNVIVTGHSLGGAMVEYFMDDIQDRGIREGVSINAVAFASPEASLDREFFHEIESGSLLNIGHENDFVYSITGTRGGDDGDSVSNFYLVHDVTNIGNLSFSFRSEHSSYYYDYSTNLLLSSQFYDETTRTSHVVVNLSTSRESVIDQSTNWLVDDSYLILGRDGSTTLTDGTVLSGDDWLVGGDGDDWLEGFRGDDILEGDIDDGPFAGGNDTMAGGEGRDVFLGTPEDLDGDTIVDLEVGDFIQLKGVNTTDIIDNFTYYGIGSNITLSFDEGLLDLFGTTVNLDMAIPTGATLKLVEDSEEAKIEVVGRGQDIAFVVDTTGSMWDDIANVKSSATEIINSVFDPERGLTDSRIAVVGFNDPTTETVLSFTDHADPEDRKTAALNAINSLSASGGGDFPELTYTGLLRALDGSSGEWREDAVARKIILFGDATAKDTHLRDQVIALANNLGADIDTSASAAALSTVDLTEDISLTSFKLSAESEDGSSVTIPVQIFTVAIGSNSSTLAEYESISEATGGDDFTSAGASGIVESLLEIINLPIYSVFASTATITEGDSGVATIEITVQRDLGTNAADATLVLSGTSDDVDRTLEASTVSFAEGELSKTIQLSISGDTTLEENETIIVTIDSVSETSTIGAPSTTVTILNDDASGGDDIINGDNNNNTLDGGAGNDQIIGNGGDDNIFGGTGNDILGGGTGNDEILDGLGNNMLDGGSGLDRLITFSGLNTISGGTDSDFLAGGFQSDNINGDAGNDVIRGEAGNGFLAGSDRITGGTGDDTMMGGRGADTFIFNTNDGNDIIAAFNTADVAFDAATGYSVTPYGSDFQSGIDHIQLDGFTSVDASNVMASVIDGADGAVFSAEGTSITFFGVDMAGITADDFIFA